MAEKEVLSVVFIGTREAIIESFDHLIERLREPTHPHGDLTLVTLGDPDASVAIEYEIEPVGVAPRVPIRVHPDTRRRLRHHLMDQAPTTRGYTDFVEDAINMEEHVAQVMAAIEAQENGE